MHQFEDFWPTSPPAGFGSRSNHGEGHHESWLFCSLFMFGGKFCGNAVQCSVLSSAGSDHMLAAGCIRPVQHTSFDNSLFRPGDSQL